MAHRVNFLKPLAVTAASSFFLLGCNIHGGGWFNDTFDPDEEIPGDMPVTGEKWHMTANVNCDVDQVTGSEAMVGVIRLRNAETKERFTIDINTPMPAFPPRKCSTYPVHPQENGPAAQLTGTCSNGGSAEIEIADNPNFGWNKMPDSIQITMVNCVSDSNRVTITDIFGGGLGGGNFQVTGKPGNEPLNSPI